MYDIILKIHSGAIFLITKVEQTGKRKSFYHITSSFNQVALLSSKMFFFGSSLLLSKYKKFILPPELENNKYLSKLLEDNKTKYITLFNL